MELKEQREQAERSLAYIIKAEAIIGDRDFKEVAQETLDTSKTCHHMFNRLSDLLNALGRAPVNDAFAAAAAEAHRLIELNQVEWAYANAQLELLRRVCIHEHESGGRCVICGTSSR